MVNKKAGVIDDFKSSTIPKLADLDSLLRCHICKDYLRAPVLTPCGHTFCSMCIRLYLNKESKCPLCLNEVRESMLHKEFLVGEIVGAFAAVKDKLLVATAHSKDDSVIDLGSDDDKNDDLLIVSESSPEPSSIGKSSTLETGHDSSANRINKKSNSIQSMLKGHSSSRNNLKETLVQCPICQELFPQSVLERTHIDECLKNGGSVTKKKTSTTRITKSDKFMKLDPSRNRGFTQTHSTKNNQPDISHLDRYLTSVDQTKVQRLPKVNFSSMSLTQTKQKLSSLGLPTTGTKQNLIDRYNFYEILWNSNYFDAVEPVDESELKRQLASWEASVRKSNPQNNNGNTISSLMTKQNSDPFHYKKLISNFKTDQFDRKAWITVFAEEFHSLKKQAKKLLKKNKLSTEKQPHKDNEESLVATADQSLKEVADV